MIRIYGNMGKQRSDVIKPPENKNAAGRRSTGFFSKHAEEGKFIPFESQGVLSTRFQRKLAVVVNVTFTVSPVPRCVQR